MNPPLQGPLPADGNFFADQGGQHVQHGTPLAGRLVEHFLVQFGDAVELQLRQIAQEFFVAWRGHVVGFLVVGGFLVVAVAAQPVVTGRVGLFQVNVFDQFAALGCKGVGEGSSRRRRSCRSSAST